MWSQSLRDFNGPSLYVYNNATFQDQDWKNIQHPEQSGKMDDPTKVGRFGLGFISVYHLTGKERNDADPNLTLLSVKFAVLRAYNWQKMKNHLKIDLWKN